MKNTTQKKQKGNHRKNKLKILVKRIRKNDFNVIKRNMRKIKRVINKKSELLWMNFIAGLQVGSFTELVNNRWGNGAVVWVSIEGVKLQISSKLNTENYYNFPDKTYF